MDQHKEALTIVETITKAGFLAYYAGGWVRDYLLNHPSDDIDIATNAPPDVIQTLFPHTVPIGLAFGIILVIAQNHQYEVATFREDFDYLDGRRPSKVAFSSAEEDAKRRDFTINGMFYDPIAKKLLDYVGGQKDLNNKIIRAIGDPHQRIQEDRLRMVRAIRLKCRFHFEIEPATQKAIRAHASELFPSVAIERVVQELMKGLKTNCLPCMLVQLHTFDLLPVIFPPLKHLSSSEIKKRIEPLGNYPKEAPLIAHLLPLFPDLPLIDQLDLSKKLKISSIDQQFITYLFSLQEHIYAKNNELYIWAHLYANPSSEKGLQIVKAHLTSLEKQLFEEEHQTRKLLLKKSIQRIKEHNPVIKSEDLMNVGIKPSKTMGLLLTAAEKIAINQQLEDREEVLTQLKELPIWPQ